MVRDTKPTTVWSLVPDCVTSRSIQPADHRSKIIEEHRWLGGNIVYLYSLHVGHRKGAGVLPIVLRSHMCQNLNCCIRDQSLGGPTGRALARNPSHDLMSFDQVASSKHASPYSQIGSSGSIAKHSCPYSSLTGNLGET